MDLKQSLVRHVFYPLWERWNGVHDLAHLRTLLAHDTLPAAALRELQRRKLRDVLLHAYRTVPFYRRRFDEAGFDPNRFEAVEQLGALPILTKDEVNRNREAMVSSQHDPSALIRDTTSGSTGDPLRFYATEGKKSFVRAVTLRENSWLGCGVGDRILRLWGVTAGASPGLKARFGAEWVRRTRKVDAHDLTDAQIDRFLRELRTYRPVLVIAYAKSIWFAAQYARRHGVEIPYAPRAIVATAEGLSPEERALVIDVFRAPVANRYASRELGQIASSCGASSRLHTVDEGCYVEIVDLPGVGSDRGRIVVTDLVNDAMPLIRYDTGDVGVRASGPCGCGRPYGVLDDVQGRLCEWFRVPGGGYLHPYGLTRPFEDDAGISNFQIVQDRLEVLRVKVVPAVGLQAPDFARLRQRLAGLIPATMRVDIEVCDVIPPAPTGKHRMSVCNLPGN
jgi:phenylacetate-CoA ligase